MPRRTRLDAELVRRGLARSREHASQLIADGRVTVRGTSRANPPPASRPTRPSWSAIVDDDPDWASRGAHKLVGALDAVRRLTRGAAAASTPARPPAASPTCCCAAAPREVVAADVGRGLLVWRLQTDDRVVVLDKTNVRALTPEQIGGPVDLVVADLSFISLRLVLPALLACAPEDADLLPMVKPQFEVGKERLGSGGVVRDPELRAEAVRRRAARGRRVGAARARRGRSPLPGPSGQCRVLRMAAPRRTADDRRGGRARARPPSGGPAMTAT